MKSESPGATKAWHIERLLRQAAPDKKITAEIIDGVARELYCSDVYVRAVARKLGYETSGQFISLRDEVVEMLAQRYPDKQLEQGSLSEIAEEMGLSRERIRQIATREGYIAYKDNIALKRRNCSHCNKPLVAKDASTARTRKYMFCDNNNVCRDAFRKEHYYTETPCEICGTPIPFRKSLLTYKMKPRFCSNPCQGKFFGARMAEVWSHSRRCPRTKEGLLQDFPNAFTEEDFRNKYKYSHASSRKYVAEFQEKGWLIVVGKKPTKYAFTIR